MNSIIVISAFVISLVVYLFIGLFHRKRTKTVADLLPISRKTKSQVNNSKEFSASTVATSISLATVVLFFFEAAPNMGMWLFWCAITTGAGIFFVKFLSPRIWKRLNVYEHRPSVHEFIGIEYNSKKVALIAAVLTSIGYLGTFGLELYLGSIFLSGLVPEIPQWSVVVVISIIGFAYTAIGGFRTVIVTDKVQMYSIWALIIGLFVFYGMYFFQSANPNELLKKIPENIFSLTWSNGLISFIIGILIINVGMFLVSMSLWQRIAASSDPNTVTKGLWRSSILTIVSWSLLILAACLVFIVVSPVEGQNNLTTLLNIVGKEGGIIGGIILFIAVIGLFGSQLSTASTQLIATAHTIYEDILSPIRKKDVNQQIKDSTRELNFSRLILVFVAILSIVVVGILSASGFSIVDLAFALYGGQLALFPIILFALFRKREELSKISSYANIAVVIGFLLGWIFAIFGKLNGIQDLVFLSPVVSLLSSSIILFFGYKKIKV